MATDVLKKASWLSANRVSVYLRLSTLLNPVIAESVVRVFDLAKVYDMLPREAALRLVASLRIARRNRQSAEPLGQTRRPLDAAGRGP